MKSVVPWDFHLHSIFALTFFFHKAEIHKIKALHFILEFLKQNVLFFKKGKHIKISLINILNYSLF